SAADPVTAVRPPYRLDRDLGFTQNIDISTRRSFRDAELACQACCGNSRAALDEFKCEERTRGRARVSSHGIPTSGSGTSAIEISGPATFAIVALSGRTVLTHRAEARAS